jgi:hypothetical protein
MQNVIRRSIGTGLVSLLLLVGFGAGLALAQSGSAGGSIGNDEKSLSGSRQTPRAVESEKPARKGKPEAEEPRRASRKSGGGSGGGGGGGGGGSSGNSGSGGSPPPPPPPLPFAQALYTHWPELASH